jgi:hypothetical protein
MNAVASQLYCLCLDYIEKIIFVISLLLYVYSLTVPLFLCVDPVPQIRILVAMEMYLGCQCLAMAISSNFHATVLTGKTMVMPLWDVECSRHSRTNLFVPP